MKLPAELPDQHGGETEQERQQTGILNAFRDKVLARTAIGTFVQGGLEVALAIGGIWYAIAGSLTWLRWVLGVLGAFFALRGLFWLPPLTMALYNCFLLSSKAPWRRTWWIWAVYPLPGVILFLLDFPWWGVFLMLFAADLLLGCIWAAYIKRRSG